jgi:hypothetical protein
MAYLTRRHLLSTSLASLAAIGVLPTSSQAASFPAIRAYRNPGCRCCEKWAEQMKQAGFTITMEDDPALDARRVKLGVPADLAGCHTALMGDYVIEGHVPPEDILKFVAANMAVMGLAVPGMPMGSPGMETAADAAKFDTLIFSADGTRSVYASH